MSKTQPKALKSRLPSPGSLSWARPYWRLLRAQGLACIIRSLSRALKPQLSSRIDFTSCAVSQLHFFFVHHGTIQFFSHHQTILKREVLPKNCTVTAIITSMATNAGLSAQCPKRVLMASGKLLDTSNSAVPTLSSYWQAILAKQAEDAAAEATEQSPTSTPSTPPVTEVIDSDPDSDLEHQQPREHSTFNVHCNF